MNHFLEIVRFELKQGFSRVSTYVYAGVFFGICFFVFAAFGGAFEGFTATTNVYFNAPVLIFSLMVSFAFFGLIVTSGVVGNAAYKDYLHDTYPLFFTQPINPFVYLLGRYTGAVLLNSVIMLALPLSMMMATFLPMLDQARLGPFLLWAYWQPYFVFVITNILFFGALIFPVALLTRRMLPTYFVAIGLIVGYLIGTSLVSDIDNEKLGALIDPFGMTAHSLETEDWTQAEKNTKIPAVTGLVLMNRLIWLGVGGVFLGLAFWRFRFSHAATIFWKKKRKSSVEESLEETPTEVNIVRAEQSFTISARRRQFFDQIRIEIKRAVRDPYFLAIAMTGAIFLITVLRMQTSMYGVKTLPVTRDVMVALSGGFGLFMIILITFYAGQIVWRERELKIDQVVDTLPVPNWIPILSKLGALMLLPGIILFVLMITGIIHQTINGFTQYQLGLYLKYLFLIDWTDYALLCVLAMTIQSLVSHKNLGHLIMILYYLAGAFSYLLGLNHVIYQFGEYPTPVYSDMNGFEPYIWTTFVFKVYWALSAVILAVVTNLFWSRGTGFTLKERWFMAKARFGNATRISVFVTIALFTAVGGYIYFNTNILNDYVKPVERERLRADYEKTYRKYLGIPQPKITDVDVKVHIFPNEGRVEFSGEYQLVNKSEKPIDSVHVRYDTDYPYRILDFGQSVEKILDDDRVGYIIYRFSEPIKSGERMSLNFAGEVTRNGFSINGVNRTVVENGTMIWSSTLFPSFGYDPSGELYSSTTRRKHDLGPKTPMPKYNDPEGLNHSLFGDDSDWITFNAVVSTSEDQIAMAPGYLEREWVEEGRRFFHYKMDKPIHNLAAFVSGRYEVMKESWNGINLEIYYHPGHTYNLGMMMEGMKKSIELYSELYGPYQYRQCRIIEFPYGSYAVSFPNTIPFSENIGFILDVDPEDPEDLDMPFWVTAHEMGHQWWPHQVAGGAVQGSGFLSEGLSEYSAVTLLEKEKGAKQLGKFLRYEMKRYLSGRAAETRFEPTIMETEGQGYIHYNKAGLLLYSLRDLIGEESMHRALGRFIEKHRYQEAPYTNIGELVDEIRSETPEELQYRITDIFDRRTIYKNKAVSASAIPAIDGQYTVTLDVETEKVYADSVGNETDGLLNDWVEIGVLGESINEAGKKEETPIYLEKVKITDSTSTFTMVVNRLPSSAGIDPLFKLVDRDLDDNITKVEIVRDKEE